MFIGITGSLCSGKHTVADFLISTHKFTHLAIRGRDHHGMDAFEFDTAADLLLYVTKQWQDNFVTCDVEDMSTLELFRKRPFFLSIAVESPVLVRFRRYLSRCQSLDLLTPTFESFITASDIQLFGASGGAYPSIASTSVLKSPMYDLMSLADLTIVNPWSTLAPLHSTLTRLDVLNQERLRPTWDTYFMQLADLAARRSNCMKRRVGCILVKESRVVATGYNGTPRGLKNCWQNGCERCNDGTPCGKGLDRCLCMHAEENALLEAGRERIGENSTLYCNTCPCLGCTIKLIQAGVKEVVYNRSYGMDEYVAKVLKEAGVTLRQHSPPTTRSELRSRSKLFSNDHPSVWG